MKKFAWLAGSTLLHELAKRIISTAPKTSHSQFSHMGAMTLINVLWELKPKP